MAPKDKRSTVRDDDVNAYQKAASPLADQTLLKALQDFIVPLIVRAVDRKKNNDINQLPLGPEAGKLIVALQEFISSVVVGSQSESEPQNMIEVDLEGEDAAESDDEDEKDDSDDSSSEGDLILELSSSKSDAENGSSVGESKDHDTMEKLQPSFHEKLLKALRGYVFNTMPIRLLGFEQHGSNLRITLLERGVIYARLASALRANLYEPDHAPENAETDQEAIERLISRYARYAILSHTWLRTESGEVTYGDWNKGKFNVNGPGYQKLVKFCKTASKDYGLVFGWMDTVCINKESSAELDESIRSMYNWYFRADVCVVYLSQTKTISNIHADTWFTRGWTLQELVAPNVIKFYNGDWRVFVENSYNDRWNSQIIKQIEQATTISEDELNDSIQNVPISRRMQLAANREVTREEDTAYSLMGIFDVSFSTAYGEGADRAFFRLLHEILDSHTNVMDIFNWGGELPISRPHLSYILPSSPQHYLRRSSNQNLVFAMPMEPLTLTHIGLRLTVVLMPAISISDEYNQHEPVGDYNATVNIVPLGRYIDIPSTYSLLDKRVSGPDGPRKDKDLYQITLGVFNFDGDGKNIYIRKTCAAIALRCYEPAGTVTDFGYTVDIINTNDPIVFELAKVNTLEGDNSNEGNTNADEANDDDEDSYQLNTWNKETYYRVKRSELSKHGMQLLSLRL